jgi:hypothetical protein
VKLGGVEAEIVSTDEDLHERGRQIVNDACAEPAKDVEGFIAFVKRQKKSASASRHRRFAVRRVRSAESGLEGNAAYRRLPDVGLRHSWLLKAKSSVKILLPVYLIKIKNTFICSRR